RLRRRRPHRVPQGDAARHAVHAGGRPADRARAHRHRRDRRRDPRQQVGHGLADQPRLWPLPHRGLHRARRGHARPDRRLRRARQRRRAPRPAMDRLTPRVRVVQVLSVSALLLAWEGVARAGWVDPLFVPAPSAVLRAFGRIGGAAPAVGYATIHGVFPILVLVTGAVRDVDRTLVTVARAFGARRWQLYWKVVLPAIVPTVLAGMRLGVVFCLLGVLVVEMFAGVRGMGYVLSSLANGFQAPELFAATALVSAASIVIVLSLDALNDRLSQCRGDLR